MLAPKPIDITSLKVVYGELNKTLLAVSQHLESYAQDSSAANSLDQARASIRQVSGILRLLGIDCANEIAELLLALMVKLGEQKNQKTVYPLKVLGHGLIGLTCYLEYMLDTKSTCKALILPFINELRSALMLPMLRESELADFSGVNQQLAPLVEKPAYSPDTFNDLFKRVRALYQVGLLGLLNEENTQAKLTLMYRSMKRLSGGLLHTPNRTLWRLSEAVLEATLDGSLEINFTRKRLFSQIDSALRNALKQSNVCDYVGDKALINELSFLVSLSHFDGEASVDVASVLSIQRASINDGVIQGQRAIMQGPSAATVSALVEATLHDLGVIKNTLETLSEGFEPDYDFTEMYSQFERIKNVLLLVRAIEPAKLLSEVCGVIKAIRGEASKDQLYSIADHVLHVESLLAELSRLKLANSDVSVAVSSNRKVILSNSQLKVAERQFIIESLESLAKSRQAFNAYLESGFNPAFIHDILLYVESLKGAVDMLGHSRASATLVNVIDALGVLAKEVPQADEGDKVFQGIADTLIALEYYLSEIQSGAKAPVSVLQVAEESMKARYQRETV